MRTLVMCVCVALLGVGTALGAEKAAAPKMMPAEFAALRAALTTIKASPDEQAKSAELGQKYQALLDLEIEKAKRNVNDRLAAEVRDVLTEEHKTQLDAVMAAARKRDDTIRRAEDIFQAKLKEIGLADRAGKAAPRGEQQLIDKLIADEDKVTRDKYQALKTKYVKMKTDGIAQLAAPDVKDRKAAKVYRDSKDEIAAKAENGLVQESRALLPEPQRLVLAQVLNTQKQFEQIVKTAEETYKQEVTAAVPPEKKKTAGGIRKPK